jgi:hypothetical protein
MPDPLPGGGEPDEDEVDTYELNEGMARVRYDHSFH